MYGIGWAAAWRPALHGSPPRRRGRALPGAEFPEPPSPTIASGSPVALAASGYPLKCQTVCLPKRPTMHCGRFNRRSSERQCHPDRRTWAALRQPFVPTAMAATPTTTPIQVPRPRRSPTATIRPTRDDANRHVDADADRRRLTRTNGDATPPYRQFQPDRIGENQPRSD